MKWAEFQGREFLLKGPLSNPVASIHFGPLSQRWIINLPPLIGHDTEAGMGVETHTEAVALVENCKEIYTRG